MLFLTTLWCPESFTYFVLNKAPETFEIWTKKHNFYIIFFLTSIIPPFKGEKWADVVYGWPLRLIANMIQEFVSQSVWWLLNFSKMWSKFCFSILSIKKKILKKARFKMTFQWFLKNSKFRSKKQIGNWTIYLFIHKCTNVPIDLSCTVIY